MFDELRCRFCLKINNIHGKFSKEIHGLLIKFENRSILVVVLVVVVLHLTIYENNEHKITELKIEFCYLTISCSVKLIYKTLHFIIPSTWKMVIKKLFSVSTCNNS